jgi:hypothetical protein
MARSYLSHGAVCVLAWVALASCPACATAVALSGAAETCAGACDGAAEGPDPSPGQNSVQSAPDAGSVGNTVNSASSSSGSSANDDASANINSQADAAAVDANDVADGALPDDRSMDAPDDRQEASGPIAPAGALYYFPLAGNTKDYSGNGHDAANTGAVSSTGHSGKPNTAYAFNGSTSFLVAPGGGLPVGNAARTLTFWTKPASARLQWGITSWGTGDCTGLMFGLGSEPTTFWAGCDDVGDGAGIPSGSWTFLAAVFSPSNKIRVFVNAKGTTYTLSTNLNTNASSLYIGADTITNSTSNLRNYFAGSIDSIRIYGRALSDAEVATVMALP